MTRFSDGDTKDHPLFVSEDHHRTAGQSFLLHIRSFDEHDILRKPEARWFRSYLPVDHTWRNILPFFRLIFGNPMRGESDHCDPLPWMKLHRRIQHWDLVRGGLEPYVNPVVPLWVLTSSVEDGSNPALHIHVCYSGREIVPVGNDSVG